MFKLHCCIGGLQYGVGWTPEHSQAKRKADVKVEIYIQAVHLLANLWLVLQQACPKRRVDVWSFGVKYKVVHVCPCDWLAEKMDGITDHFAGINSSSLEIYYLPPKITP